MRIYEPLTGKRRSLTGFTQLWQGPDHLLLVNSSRFTETYQRFSFADIQAIVITDGPDRTVPQILALLASIAWGSAAFAVDLQFGKWFFAITGLLFVALAIRDIARGPRCRCFLHTAVSRWPLPPVSRQRTARKFVGAIVPAVEAVQGTLPAEQFAQIAVSDGTASASTGSAPPPAISSPRLGAVHILFGLFFLDAALFWVAFHWPQTDIGVYLLTALLGELLLAVMALFQGRANPLRFSYVLTVLAIAGIVADSIRTGRMMGTIFLGAALRQMGTLPPDLLLPKNGSIFAFSWRIIAGIAGLAAVFYERKRTSES
ncbi:MAG TPA: hypothetical protein VKT49_14380 [Bryobacteraceae bacterium]|nr:hypothetical protein [Bryobacteraceae bacterium]